MEKANNGKIKISFFINVMITIMTVAALIIAFTGFKFMHGYEPSEDLTKTKMFSYFTVQANTFMGTIAFIYAIKEFQVLKGVKKSIPLKYNILKMIATVAVGLTFFVVFACLSFGTKGGIVSLIKNSNLFFHLIIPVISVVNFVVFEKTGTIKYKYTFCGLIPTGLYEVYYIINILTNMENGKVNPVHDWYGFLQNGLWAAIIVAPMMLGITYVISLIIWKLNRKK